MTTIAEELRHAEGRLREAGIEDGRIEAEVLLRHALGLSREALYAQLRDPLPDPHSFESLLERRLRHEPAAYITGHKEFYGLDLLCTPDALIPRPETELLVELALDHQREQGTGNREQGPSPPLVVDVGTGNGAIAVAIAVHAPEVRVLAVDTSRRALRLARKNGGRQGVDKRIDFLQASLLSVLRGRFEVLVANLPYVSEAEYERAAPEIRAWEPKAALRAGPAGTELIEALLSQASDCLAPGGLLLAEHAWDQGERLRAAARASFPHARVETRRDLAGEERVLVVERERS